LNLHEIYGDFQGKVVDRDEVEPEHFKSWIEWGKENNMKLDFNSTSFSHPKSGDLSLSNPDEGIRNFWIEHTKRCRAVAEEMGKAQGDPCIMNLWVHDGSKDITVNRMKYRALLKDSLDQIFATEYKNMKDCIESKVFGIGLESYTVGSNDFYIGYGAKNNKMITLDTGHFHPTESVADKVSSLLLYVPELMLHVSRPVRWDSDHVTIMDDPTMDLFSEIVRCNALDRVHYGLDYFDASINRIGAYVIGSRAAQKCMVRALLEPIAKLREYLYGDADYSGNYIPYVPQQTLMLGGDYTWNLSARYVDRLIFSAQYTATGRHYWNDSNDVRQGFYGILNGKLSAVKRNLTVDLWIKNAASKEYMAYFFQTSGKYFAQKGKPLTFGTTISFTL
jgi:L-rhamnose isomerase